MTSTKFGVCTAFHSEITVYVSNHYVANDFDIWNTNQHKSVSNPKV